MKLGLYAIIDTVAKAILGNIIICHAHPASAVRMFTDALQDPKTTAAQHPADYILVCLGYVGENHHESIYGLAKPDGTEIILTGAAWLASVSTKPELLKES